MPILTPPLAAPDVPSIRRRLAAMIYESLLISAVLVFGFLLPQTLWGFLNGYIAPAPVLLWHVLLLVMLYCVWFWTHGGQTPAQKTWKFRVVDVSGRPLRPLQAVFRYLAAWFTLGLCGIGILWALFDPDRQFLHDRIVGSRLVLV
ncbi:MAG: RDD family protein [Zoogloeaceae bacterium]|jgi:uncharacterized RDD family membrane protein YckC|nr:RDD family protein [Zoogloeaceae bacterium]